MKVAPGITLIEKLRECLNLVVLSTAVAVSHSVQAVNLKLYEQCYLLVRIVAVNHCCYEKYF